MTHPPIERKTIGAKKPRFGVGNRSRLGVLKHREISLGRGGNGCQAVWLLACSSATGKDAWLEGINKTMNHGAKEVHARSVAEIPDLLKNAVLVATETNRNERQSIDIKSVHHFYAPLRLAGRDYVARLVVKEARNGQLFYDHDTSDEISPAVSTLASEHLPKEESATKPDLPKEGGMASKAGFKMSMAKLLSHVNVEHGGTDRKFVRYSAPENRGADICYASESGKMDQTDMPEFRRWFGESKVVDRRCMPRRATSTQYAGQ
jgi:Large polyvalent protein-associated domain 3